MQGARMAHLGPPGVRLYARAGHGTVGRCPAWRTHPPAKKAAAPDGVGLDQRQRRDVPRLVMEPSRALALGWLDTSRFLARRDARGLAAVRRLARLGEWSMTRCPPRHDTREEAGNCDDSRHERQCDQC